MLCKFAYFMDIQADAYDDLMFRANKYNGAWKNEIYQTAYIKPICKSERTMKDEKGNKI